MNDDNKKSQFDFSAFSNMCNWERQKALYLFQIADKLGLDLDDYAQIGVNPNSGYTYLWLESEPFTLYMPISCELREKDVYVLWTDATTGKEVEKPLSIFTDRKEIYDWIEELESEGDE